MTDAATALTWDDALRDRAAGVLGGLAVGDALGAPYEFGPPVPEPAPVGMVGGGSFNWEPGEWTDDTQMAVVLLDVAVSAHRDGQRLLDRLDDVVAGWVQWARTAPDVGAQTRAVLAHATDAASATRAGAELHARTGRSGGNGSLMRTAPVALAYLDDPAGLVVAARAVSALTHHDPDAGDACVLWCLAIRHAVLTGELDVRVGLDLVRDRQRWSDLVDDAERRRPADFVHNGWVVEAFQAAWSAIAGTDGLAAGIEAAVRGGRDADTVAAIAGSLLGARWGASAVPGDWWRIVHGWPGLQVWQVARRGLRLAHGEESWPGVCPHDGGPAFQDPRYDDALCGRCRGRATDAAGRSVDLHNATISGGFLAQHRDDGTACGSVTQGHRVLIDGLPYAAGEARFGGVVVQPVTS